jgi:hypothetical protein
VLEYCIGTLGLGLPSPLGPQPIRVGEAQHLVLLPLPSRRPNPNGLWSSHSPLGLGLGEAQPLVLLLPLAAGPRGSSPYILYPLLINTSITFFPNSHLLSWYHEIELDLDSSRFRPAEQRLARWPLLPAEQRLARWPLLLPAEQRLCAPALPSSAPARAAPSDVRPPVVLHRSPALLPRNTCVPASCCAAP